MKALICTAYGSMQNLVIDDLPTPTLLPTQVLIRVKACGINFPDTLMLQGKYQVKPTCPFVLGGEVTGHIVAVGSSVQNLAVGATVIAFTGWGGMASYVVADATRTYALPQNIDLIAAAGIFYNYCTVYYALKNRGQLQANESLLVLGAGGGIGLAAVNLGHLLGAKVIAAASTNEKLALSQDYGADLLLNYQQENLREKLNELTANQGIDVVLDPIGGTYTEQAFRAMAWQGRYLVVGFATGQIPQLPLNLALLKGASIVGVFWGAFSRKEEAEQRANMNDLIQWFLEGKLAQQAIRTCSLSDVPAVLEAIMERNFTGKAVMVM